MLRHPTSIALTAIANSVTADGCVHIAESVGSRRELVANSRTHRRRRRDATKQFRRVGVGGVYWALDETSWADNWRQFADVMIMTIIIHILSNFRARSGISSYSCMTIQRILWLRWLFITRSQAEHSDEDRLR